MTAAPASGSLARRLREWRTREGLSLTGAARRLGVHQTTYQRWEQGKRPYPRHCCAIADLLGESAAAIFTLAGPGPRRLGRAARPDASFLTKARLAAGLNRVALGRVLHVGPATVYQWERGNVRPHADLVGPLAATLRLSLEDLHAALAGYPPCRHDGDQLPYLGRALRRRGVARETARMLLGIGKSTIFEWETGKRRVPTWALRRLAAECGVTIDHLIREGRLRTPLALPESELKALRRRVHMTQREAAAVMSISTSSLSRYEAGHRALSFSLARTMARTYRVPLARVLRAAKLTPPLVILQAQWPRDELPAVLRELRATAGLSMCQIARSTGVSPPTVRRWESGESTPSPRALAALESHYRLRPGRLTCLGRARVDGVAAMPAAVPSPSDRRSQGPEVGSLTGR